VLHSANDTSTGNVVTMLKHCVVSIVIKKSLTVIFLHQPGSLSLLAPEKCSLPLRYVISHCYILLCIYQQILLKKLNSLKHIVRTTVAKSHD